MEQRVISEFEKYRNSIEDALKKRLGVKLSDKEIASILEILGGSVMEMIQLMKEGKSAHEKFFSDIILNSIDAIVGIDNEFKIFLWNKGAEQMFGYTKEETMGKDFAMLLPQDKLRAGEREFLVKEVNEKGFLANYETDRITKDGNLINVSITRFLIHNEKMSRSAQSES